MSVAYLLCCESCQDATEFVSRSETFTWMADATPQVPKFLHRHASHLSSLRVLDEFRWATMRVRHLVRSGAETHEE